MPYQEMIRHDKNLSGMTKSKMLWMLESGASVSNNGVQFRVWAPEVTSISLVLVEGSKEIPMDLEENRYFTTF